MSTRPLPAATVHAAEQLGQHLANWRKLLHLTADQVAQRAGITRGTLRRLERGEPSTGMAAFLSVTRALGQLDRVVTALDPYETDLGRARADQILPERVRH